MDVREMARQLAAMGDGDDLILAHISPREAALLADTFGGDINSKTGLPQFDFWSKAGHALNPFGSGVGAAAWKWPFKLNAKIDEKIGKWVPALGWTSRNFNPAGSYFEGRDSGMNVKESGEQSGRAALHAAALMGAGFGGAALLGGGGAGGITTTALPATLGDVTVADAAGGLAGSGGSVAIGADAGATTVGTAAAAGGGTASTLGQIQQYSRYAQWAQKLTGMMGGGGGSGSGDAAKGYSDALKAQLMAEYQDHPDQQAKMQQEIDYLDRLVAAISKQQQQGQQGPAPDASAQQRQLVENA